jgi:hypothetical protein
MSKRRGRKSNPNAKRRKTTRAGRTGEIIPVDVLRQRARAAGIPITEAKDSRAGCPWGQLVLRRVITDRQAEAGKLFADLRGSFLAQAQGPRMTPKAQDMMGDRPGHRMIDEIAEIRRWEKTRTAYREAARVLARQGTLAEVVIAELCMSGHLSPNTCSTPGAAEALREALTALAAFWRIPLEREIGGKNNGAPRIRRNRRRAG